MDIRTRFNRQRRVRKWIAEVWSDDQNEHMVSQGYDEPYPEEVYTEINDWCRDNLGYAARTAYHIFEFKKKSDLDWFILRWS